MRLPWIPLKNVIFGLAVPAMVGQTERDCKSSIKLSLKPLYKKRKSKFESLKGTDTKVCTEVGFRWKHFVVPTMVGPAEIMNQSLLTFCIRT